MLNNIAFITKTASCPICQAKSMLRYPNPRLYVVAKRESDMRVNAYRWSSDEFSHILPHYYAVWQCSECLFAEMVDFIEKPKETMKESHLHGAFENIPVKKQRALEELRKLLPEEELDHRGALALHLAAVMITTLPKEEDIDHDKLGRLSLRLGWLFRERTPSLKEIEAEGGVLGKLGVSVERLESQILTLTDVLNGVMRAAADRAAELGLPTSGEGNPYSSVISTLGDKLTEMHTLLSLLQRSVLHDERGELEGIKAGEPEAESDLDEMLLTIRPLWPEMPINEEQSLRLAVEAYDYSYEHESTYQSIEQCMTILGLIIDVLTRIGEHERALDYIADIYKTGMSSKQELRSRIASGQRSKSIRAHDVQMLHRKIGNINLAISQYGETRRQIIDIIIEKNKETINMVLTENIDKPPEEQERALVQAGIPDVIIPTLRSRKILKKKTKKPGLFGR